MSDTEVTLYFYLEPERFPYKYLDNLDLKNEELVREMAPSTWWSWTLRTYLHLRDHFTCQLVDTMPEKGIIFFFRGSVSFFQKPKPGQFWVCMVGDSSWHIYSQINIFQNPIEAKKWPCSYFVHHWPQINIMPSIRHGKPLENIYYFGTAENLAKEFKEKDWADFCSRNNLKFHICPSEKWNDYRNADLVLAVRSFDDSNSYDNKPSSKLVNAWIAGVPFIARKESAYLADCKLENEIIFIDTYDNLKNKTHLLTNNKNLLEEYRKASQKKGEEFSMTFFLGEWSKLICAIVDKKKKEGYYSNLLFLFKRLIFFTLTRTKNRLTPSVNKKL